MNEVVESSKVPPVGTFPEPITYECYGMKKREFKTAQGLIRFLKIEMEATQPFLSPVNGGISHYLRNDFNSLHGYLQHAINGADEYIKNYSEAEKNPHFFQCRGNVHEAEKVALFQSTSPFGKSVLEALDNDLELAAIALVAEHHAHRTGCIDLSSMTMSTSVFIAAFFDYMRHVSGNKFPRSIPDVFQDYSGSLKEDMEVARQEQEAEIEEHRGRLLAEFEQAKAKLDKAILDANSRIENHDSQFDATLDKFNNHMKVRPLVDHWNDTIKSNKRAAWVWLVAMAVLLIASCSGLIVYADDIIKGLPTLFKATGNGTFSLAPTILLLIPVGLIGFVLRVLSRNYYTAKRIAADAEHRKTIAHSYVAMNEDGDFTTSSELKAIVVSSLFRPLDAETNVEVSQPNWTDLFKTASKTGK